jgi:hypothetical protein
VGANGSRQRLQDFIVDGHGARDHQELPIFHAGTL